MDEQLIVRTVKVEINSRLFSERYRIRAITIKACSIKNSDKEEQIHRDEEVLSSPHDSGVFPGLRLFLY